MPSGLPVLELIIAVKQSQFGKESVGYFEASLEGREAEDLASTLKVGVKISVNGCLWMRQYRNRQGSQVKETRLVLSDLKL